MDERSQPSLLLTPRSLVTLWRFSLATPAIYMAVAIAVNRLAFPPERDGLWPMRPEAYRVLFAAIVACAAVMSGVVVWLRGVRARGEDAGRYQRLTFWMLALCDMAALLGLSLYLVQGDAHAQGGLSLLAWGAYAVARPAAPPDSME